MRHPSFEFHCIPVGIDNCYLLRGRTTILIDAVFALIYMQVNI